MHILWTGQTGCYDSGGKEIPCAGSGQDGEFRPGVRTIVSRNPEYWRDGRPYLDEVELIGIPDEMARVNALLSGDAAWKLGLSGELRCGPIAGRREARIDLKAAAAHVLAKLEALRADR